MKNYLMISVLAVTLSAFFNTALAEDASPFSCSEMHQFSVEYCKGYAGCTRDQMQNGATCNKAQLEACYAQGETNYYWCLHPQQVKNP